MTYDKILLTGLWKKRNKRGELFFSSMLSFSSGLYMEQNKGKQAGSKQPDYLLYVTKYDSGPKSDI